MNERKPPDATDANDDDPVYEQAALWVARLSSPDVTEADRRACDAWCAADPRHAEAYAEMQEWRRAMGRVPDPRRKRRSPKGVAAIAAFGLVGVLAYHLGFFDRMRADAWTDVGEIETTMLTDGSRVDLNTDTALAVHFTSEERGITLLRGEAAFDVVSDPGRPFVVRGAGLSARAVGTRFFVRVDRATGPVGVAEGRVEIATEAGRAMLGAGEVLSRDANGHPAGHQGDVAQAMAWREGKLVVSGQPLSAVLAELERYRRGRILMLAPELAGRRFSGTLDLRDTDHALGILATTMGFRAVRLTPLLVLIRPLS